MSMIKKSAALAVTVLSLAGAAYAAAQWPSFQDADKDKSGALESKEAKAIKGLDFKAADADRDGKVSQVEYEMAKSEQSGGGMGGTAPGGASGGAAGGATGTESYPRQ